MSTTNQQKYVSANPLRKIFLRPFQKKFFGLLQTLSLDSILEVGAGEGYIMSRLAELLPSRRLRGYDLIPEVVTEGRRLWPTLDLQVGDIYHIPEPDGSWDMVIASEVLEHLERPEDALRELRRVSRKYVLLSVPHEPWFRLLNFARGKHLIRFGNHPEHVNNWTQQQFVDFVITQLTVDQVISAFPWTIILARV